MRSDTSSAALIRAIRRSRPCQAKTASELMPVCSHTSATGTDFGGVQRLRNRLNLQFDAPLPRDWKAPTPHADWIDEAIFG